MEQTAVLAARTVWPNIAILENAQIGDRFRAINPDGSLWCSIPGIPGTKADQEKLE